MAYKCKFTPLRKSELADLLGISPRQLRRWLNEMYFAELVPLGYDKNMVTLPPNIVQFLTEKLCITTD
jgi:hypothetical protein